MTFCPEHPKWDQNPKFTPLSETTSIPASFKWKSSPGVIFSSLDARKQNNRQLQAFHWQIPSSPPSERGRCYAAPSSRACISLLSLRPAPEVNFRLCSLNIQEQTICVFLSRICRSIWMALFLAKRERTLLCMLWIFINFPHWDFSHVMRYYFFLFLAWQAWHFCKRQERWRCFLH